MPRLELRGIKRLEKNSEETHCYNATLYFDHIKVAEVSNEGRGGPDRVHWIKPDAEKQVNDYLDSLPEIDLDIGGEKPDMTKMDLELWCGLQVDDHLVARDYNRLMRKCVAFYNPETKEIFETNHKPDALKPPGGKAIRQKILQENPGCVVLNDLSFDEGIKYYNSSYGVSNVQPVDKDDFEADDEELLKQQQRRAKLPQDEDELSDEQRAQFEEVKATLEQPVEGETSEERSARLERNNQRLAEVNPKLKRLLEHVNKLVEERKSRKVNDEHPGARLKNPGDGDMKPARSDSTRSSGQPAKPKEAAPGSLRDRLQRAGIKPVGHPKRREVANLICSEEGASTAELSEKTGATPHDIGNHIFYLKWENGYKIETKKVGKVNKYFGRPPSEEEVAASKRQAEPEAVEQRGEEAA